MGKILTSLGMIVFVGAVVVGGTGAFFSDTETSTANVFTAGALDLRVDSVAHINGLVCFQGAWTDEDIIEWVPETDDAEGFLQLIDGENVDDANNAYNSEFPANVPQAGEACEGTWEMTDLGPEHTFFDYGDIKPGDNGENTISLHVYNNDAYMCAIIDNVVNNDNGITEPESEVDDTDGEGNGELQQELNFFVWDDDGDNIFEDGENVLVQSASGEDIAGTYPLFTPETGAITGSSTQYLGVYWCYGEFNGVGDCDGGPVTNLTQTDSLSADITFYIEQARNNEDFVCPGRVVVPETTLSLEKVIQQDQFDTVTEAAWTLFADGPVSISGSEGDADVTNKVVPAGDYDLSESGLTGFTQTDLQCSGGVLVGDTVTIAEGENVTCTFTNVEDTLITT